MRFPSYPATAYEQPRSSVIEGYIGFFGSFEADNRAEMYGLPRDSLRKIAMRIGRGCVIAAAGNDKAANRVFRRVQGDLEPQLRTPLQRKEYAGMQAAQLLTTAQMLEFRDDSAATAEARQTMHIKTVNDTRRLLKNLTRTDEHRLTKGEVINARGKLVEKIGLGLLTRFSAHPWFMGSPALIHHDQGARRRDNFDILFVETSAESDYVSARKIQAKSGCLGICEGPLAQTIDRSQYASDITFLSGCCDLGFRGSNRYHLAELLVQEVDDAATPLDIAELDLASNSLMLSLSVNGPERRGTSD